MVAAALKFTQGMTTAPAGQALIGAIGTFTAASGDASGNPTYFEFTVVDVPPGSAQAVGLVSAGPLSSITLLGDVRGGYLVHLLTQDQAGNQSVDERVFQIPEASGRLIPPFAAKASALNFSAGTRGWAPIMESWLHAIDAGGSGSVYLDATGPVTASPATATGRVHVAAHTAAGAVLVNLPHSGLANGCTYEIVDADTRCGRTGGNIYVASVDGFSFPVSTFSFGGSPRTGIVNTEPGGSIVVVWNNGSWGRQ